MGHHSRRRFLKQVAAVGTAAAVRPLGVLAGEAAKTEGVADMSIIRWGGPTVPEEGLKSVAARLTEQALDALGGMGRFVSRGDIVWVKPNMGWNRAPELAANTNPDVVAALVRLCFEAGAKEVKVGDNTCNKPAQCYRSSGIEAAAAEVGAKIVFLDERRFRDVKIGGRRLTEWPLYPEILESDLVINVPVAKHHGLCRVSLGMKNYMGVIGGRRNSWHQDLTACLCDLTAYMKPRLCVLDAIRVLTDHGPQGGNVADVTRMGTVAAGTDIVALDAFGAELLGHEPEEIDTLKAAQEAELGRIRYRELPLREIVLT